MRETWAEPSRNSYGLSSESPIGPIPHRSAQRKVHRPRRVAHGGESFFELVDAGVVFAHLVRRDWGTLRTAFGTNAEADTLFSVDRYELVPPHA